MVCSFVDGMEELGCIRLLLDENERKRVKRGETAQQIRRRNVYESEDAYLKSTSNVLIVISLEGRAFSPKDRRLRPIFNIHHEILFSSFASSKEKK